VFPQYAILGLPCQLLLKGTIQSGRPTENIDETFGDFHAVSGASSFEINAKTQSRQSRKERKTCLLAAFAIFASLRRESLHALAELQHRLQLGRARLNPWLVPAFLRLAPPTRRGEL
jgi:hypothetical protein